MIRRAPICVFICTVFCLLTCLNTLADDGKRVQVSEVLDEVIAKNSLVSPGSTPFYLKATLLDPRHPDSDLAGEVEIHWIAPDKWRRVIKTKAFSQTHVVNGKNVFELNSSEYFPWELEQLVTAIITPVPPEVGDELKKMDFPVQKPDGSHNACRADKYVTMKERYVFTLNCETGNLWWINVPGWDAGVFDDYHRFHDKHIAFRTKDNPLVFKIDSLRDLGNTDESLFSIAVPIPAGNVIRTVYVHGPEFRKLAVKTPEFKWPQVTNRPDSGDVTVYIVVDKSGHVRHSHSYAASNNEVKDAAVEQIKNWEFTPFVVDGTPVQVQTALVIDFKTDLKADPNRKPPAKEFFDRARNLNDIRLKASSPFHLNASFEAFGETDITGKGTYDETWISPTQWRREASINGHTVIESRNDDLRYRQFKGEYSPRLVDDVIDVMGAALPGDNDDFFLENDWHVGDGKIGSLPLTRVWHGYINDQGLADVNTVIYYFSQTTGMLRAHLAFSELIGFNDFLEFVGKQVPRHITVGQNRDKVLDIKVETLESAKPQEESFFILPGVKPWSLDDDESGSQLSPPKPIKQVKPVYPEEARTLNLHQKLSCTVSVDSHGHPRTIEFQGDYNEYLKAALAQALMQWEFQAGVIKGRPVSFPFRVDFQF
jgi:outer membrane biosynthesis protein TonB